MPDIQTLTSAVQSLETSASRWSKGALWLIAATAIVATLYFIVSWVASRKATALQQAQATLLRAKDAQLATDLKDKDVLIANADKKAGEANERASNAKERAEQIAGENIKLKGELDRATEEARKRAEELKRQNLATEARLEEERSTRLELESALAPRFVPQSAIAPQLMTYAGMKVVIETIDDFEATRLAGQLYVLVEMAGWKVLRMNVIPPAAWHAEYFDGVVVWHRVGPDADRSMAAAEILTDELNAHKIGARVMPEDLPTDTLLVRVGLRPATYFFPKNVKEQLKKAEEIMRDARKRRREAEEKFRQKPNP